MARIADLLSYVHDELPAVPQLVAERALQDAARTFCYYSTVWRERLPAITVPANRSVVEVTTEDGTEMVTVTSARFNGKRIEVITDEKADSLDDANMTASWPLAIQVENPNQVRLFPAPQMTVPQGLVLKAALQPARGASEIPDFIFSRYGADIGSGAKERLCRMKGQPWSDPGAANDYAVDFRRETAKAKRDIETSFNAAQTQVQLRKWV